MKTKEDIYLEEVNRAYKADEKFGKLFLSDAIRKFTLNCLMIMEDQYRQPVVSRSALKKICDKCGGEIKRTYPYPCPTNGKTYCEKCIDPEGNIYNDRYFGKTDR